ncbi:MAG: helix-turn-helix domain-containing protein [Solirubrobacteraceae bacterium]
MQAVSMTEPFGEVLRERRRQLGLSQAEAAELVGASEKSWRRWEKGEIPSEEFLAAIRDKLGVAMQTDGPRAEAAQAMAELERALSVVRERLDRATNVHADLVLQRPDGATLLIEVKAFGGETDLEDEAVALIRSAAHEAGWTVHITP